MFHWFSKRKNIEKEKEKLHLAAEFMFSGVHKISTVLVKNVNLFY